MRIGDVVTIIDIGCIYPTFQVMAEQLGADFDKWENNRMGGGSLAGSNAKILNINTDNINDDHILIEVLDGRNIGEQYVIGMDGVDLDMAANILGDDLFDI